MPQVEGKTTAILEEKSQLQVEVVSLRGELERKGKEQEGEGLMGREFEEVRGEEEGEGRHFMN